MSNGKPPGGTRPGRAHGGDEGVPVLTEIVDLGAELPRVPPEVAEALAREVERALLERLGEDLDRMIEQRLARALGALLDEARADITEGVRMMLREAIAAAVAKALGNRAAGAHGAPPAAGE